MDDKYLPSIERRKDTIETQISESQAIIYRNLIELPGFVANGQKNQVAEVKFNNDQLKEKIDILYDLLEELNQEK